MRMEIDQEYDEESESDVRDVLNAARGFLSESPTACERDVEGSPASVLSGARSFVGAEGIGARISLSPPGSSPGEADDYYFKQTVTVPKRCMVRPSRPSRRVAVDHAVGNASLIEKHHIIYITKNSNKSQGFGIKISDDLRVISCAARSPADGHLQMGSRIVQVDDHLVHSRDDFRRLTRAVAPGDTAAFTVSL
jgi:hypothetical protein